MPFLTCVSSLAGTSREACPTLTGKPLKRSVKVLVCWRASSVVGTTTATCLPSSRWRTPRAAQPRSCRSRRHRRSAGPSGGRFEIAERRRRSRPAGHRFPHRGSPRRTRRTIRPHRHFRRIMQMSLSRDLDQLVGDLADAVLQCALRACQPVPPSRSSSTSASSEP